MHAPEKDLSSFCWNVLLSNATKVIFSFFNIYILRLFQEYEHWPLCHSQEEMFSCFNAIHGSSYVSHVFPMEAVIHATLGLTDIGSRNPRALGISGPFVNFLFIYIELNLEEI